MVTADHVFPYSSHRETRVWSDAVSEPVFTSTHASHPH